MRMMRNQIMPVLAFCLGLIWVNLPANAVSSQTLLTGLYHPWSLAFLSETEILIVERRGTIIKYNLIDQSRIDIENIPPVYEEGQGGLFDIILHPDFKNNQFVYLSLAAGNEQQNGTDIIRARLIENRLVAHKTIFKFNQPKDTPLHFGGRMAFLPDKTLLLTLGDGYYYRDLAQDLTSLFGKVIRLTDQGEIPADNPFLTHPHARPEIFTYGHRNPQGLAYDPVHQHIILHEHGPRGGDEVNILQAGKNYGWPKTSYGIDYNGDVITPFTEMAGIESPLLHWTPSIAPSGLTIYQGDRYPQFQGDYLVGALAKRHLRHVSILDGKVSGQRQLLTNLGERIRDVRTGPDGYIYLLTDSEDGQLIRLRP